MPHQSQHRCREEGNKEMVVEKQGGGEWGAEDVWMLIERVERGTRRYTHALEGKIERQV